MSTPENAATAAAIAPTEIPDKLYFRIGDVARLAGIKPYVLRFWETEFPGLGPRKSGTGHRLYRRKDVELVLEIKRLLYDQRFTIEGARKFLETRPKADAQATPRKPSKRRAAKAPAAPETKGQVDLFGTPAPNADALETVRTELRSILELLK